MCPAKLPRSGGARNAGNGIVAHTSPTRIGTLALPTKARDKNV
jgi:hypothetical protein